MNVIGPVAALSAFFSIWFGHVTVRKIEFRAASLAMPAILFLASGLLLEWLALRTPLVPLSTALGIIGITLLWDALELGRQQRRVQKGHAPANPRNPRHAAFLAEPGSCATCVNPLKREPGNDLPSMNIEERGIIY